MSARSELEHRARRAIFKHAILSPQSLSLLLISVFGTGLGISFLGGDPLLWLGFGAIAELFYLGATITDPRAASHAVSDMFRRDYNPADIRNPHARQRLEQALAYHRNMQSLAAETAGARRVQIEATVSEVDDWLEQIFRMARRIDNYNENELINRDRLRVPNELGVLRQRHASETNANLQAELAAAIRLKETQWANLQALETNIKRADIQLDNTLAALGTVFAQLQLMDSKSGQGGRVQRLQQDITEEIASLKDTIDAIDDVQAHSEYMTSYAAR